ncbi:hypothetical protein DZF93_11195, partial [Clavibacter michiganensis subsp. insidiosus]
MTSPATPALRPEHPVARSLSGLVSDFALDVVGDVDDVEVTGSVRLNNLFLGVGIALALLSLGIGAIHW